VWHPLLAMKKKAETNTFHYKEDEIKNAIEHVETLAIPDSIKTILLHCLNTCLSINSLLQKNRSLRRVIGRLFGFKTEKKSPKKTNLL
jgi:hypothetical protein